MNIKGKKILVTGSRSFLGKSLVPLLEGNGSEVISFKSKDYNLKNQTEVKRLFNKTNPEIVIHLAVDNGGINYTKNNPGSIFYNNVIMNTLVQEESRKREIEKFIGIGSAASYPKMAVSPIKEESFWEGYPDETHASIGLSKRAMLLQSQAYRQQYDFNAIHLISVNLYGPNYSLDPKSIRIVPLLIKNLVEAKESHQKKIELSGTENTFIEFLYVKDCSEAIIKATENYNKPLPVNIGYGEATRIGDLANKIKEIVGFRGEILWKEDYIDERLKRTLDISRAEREFGFKAKTNLEEGLRNTIEWYFKQKDK